MKFFYKEPDTKAVADRILKELGARELGKILTLDMKKDLLSVTISKLGTSVLEFKVTSKDGGWQFDLASEKIAFTHRAFKDDVKDKFCKVIEKTGGKLIA